MCSNSLCSHVSIERSGVSECNVMTTGPVVTPCSRSTTRAYEIFQSITQRSTKHTLLTRWHQSNRVSTNLIQASFCTPVPELGLGISLCARHLHFIPITITKGTYLLLLKEVIEASVSLYQLIPSLRTVLIVI
jgi:hypothetical protein